LKTTATTRYFRFSVNLVEARKIASLRQTAKARDNGFQEVQTFVRKSSEIKELRYV